MARGRFCVFVFAVVAALFVVIPGASEAPASRAHDIELAGFEERPGHMHTLVAEPFERNFVYGIQNLQPNLTAAKTATINVTYTGFTPAAQAAFQTAVNIWESIVTSSVPIRVNANFISLGSGILGSAGATVICRDFTGAPQTSTWYPGALANKLAGTDFCFSNSLPGNPHITANFNSDFTNWSFNTTGADIGLNYSFVTVVLHELGHGLGFFGSAFATTDVPPLGTYGQSGFPYIYDRFVEDGSGISMLSGYTSSSTALGNLLISGNVFFDGPQTRANNGNAVGKLESTLNPFNPGSSFSHVDDALYNNTPNALMTYALAQNERVFDPGPIVKGMFTDMGWTTTNLACNYALSANSATFGIGGGAGTVTVITTAGCAWTATSNNPSFITVTGGASGTGTGTVSYSVAAASGARVGTMTIAGNTFTVTQTTQPTMTLTPASINMAAVNNGGGTLLSQTPPQTLALTQVGAGTVTWTATSDSTWLTLAGPSGTGTSTSGTGPANLTLSINNSPPVLPTMGTRTATVTVTTSGAANNPTATVHLTVYLNGMTNVPAGHVDTPSPGATNVTGSIAVTGWAIDDVGVVSTKICRLPVAGESALPNPNCNNQAQIFIGDGTFINGARPDVAAAFPNTPQKDRAGWGYLMLTNFLPNAGNGTFTLVTWVTSSDGQTVQIDARAITCTNATATAPFGAIDTPEQGGTASGASYVNFGWVLAARPEASGLFIPIDGSTVQVFVDGISRGVLDSYNNARPDIQAAFPGYFNTDGAVGVKFLDTTTLANGLHTIFWIAADDVGTAAGIGSRFFTVSNSALIAEFVTEATEGPGSGGAAPVAHGHPSAVAQGPSAVAQGFSPAPAGAGSEDPAYTRSFVDAVPRVMGDLGSVAWLRHSDAAVAVAHGFDAGAQPELVTPDAQFVRVVRTVQLDRVLIDLSATGDGAATYRGYTLDGELLRGLPVGSTLDAETGHFAWAVGLGFGGSHDLVFVRTGAHESAQIRVRVEIAAESASKGEPRLVIDTPVHDATVGGQFTIAGWAFDPNGPGTGVDTLHVWAYPVGARGSGLGAGGADAGLRDPGAGLRTHTDPIWIGVAAYGGVRPDVGNAFGARFAASGYSVEAAGLAPGTYDIVVYAHSTATSSFRIARMVRVTVR